MLLTADSGTLVLSGQQPDESRFGQLTQYHGQGDERRPAPSAVRLFFKVRTARLTAWRCQEVLHGTWCGQLSEEPGMLSADLKGIEIPASAPGEYDPGNRMASPPSGQCRLEVSLQAYQANIVPAPDEPRCVRSNRAVILGQAGRSLAQCPGVFFRSFIFDKHGQVGSGQAQPYQFVVHKIKQISYLTRIW